MGLLGRAAEVRTISRRIDRAREGTGSIVLVHGELGIGKTRLLERAAELGAAAGGATASGRWYESPEVPAYVGFLEALGQLLGPAAEDLRESLDVTDPHVLELARLGPEVAHALGLDVTAPIRDDADQYGLWRGVVLLLEAVCGSHGPVVLTLDDAQWADQSSIELLDFIGRNVAGLPLVIVVGERDAPEAERSLVGDILGGLPGGVTVEMELRGLGWEAAQELAAEALGGPVDEATSRSIRDYANGNPLFVEEICRRLSRTHGMGERLDPAQVEQLLRHDLPKGIRSFMAQRFETLTAETQYLLQLAACFGRTFDLLLLEEIAEVDRQTLSAIVDEGLSGGVVSEREPGQFAFTHPLMREVTYAAIPPANRIAIHERVASAIERHYGDRASLHAREIANHLISSGGLADPSKAVRYCTVGARQARGLFAWDEMYRLASAAIRAASSLTFDAPRLRVSLMIDKAYALTMLGQPDDALATYRDALRIYRRLRDIEGIVDCQRWIATALLRYGRWTEAAAVTAPALEGAPEARSHAYIALAGTHALAAMVNGRLNEAGLWSDKLLELSFDDETKAVAHHAAAGHNSWGTGDPEAAMEHFDACRSHFLRIAHDGTAAQVAADQTVAAYLLGHVERSRTLYAQASDLARRTNRITAVAELSTYRAVLHTHEGSWHAAEEADAEWKALSAEMGGSTIYGQLAERAGAARRLWRDGPATAGDLLVTASPLRSEPLQAVLLAEEGKARQAAELVQVIRKNIPNDGRGLFWLSIALPTCSAQVTLRDRAAPAWIPGLLRYSGGAFGWCHVDIELGRSYALAGDWERCDDHFERAFAQCERDDLHAFSALAHYRHGELLLERRGRNHRRRGLAEMERAQDEFARIGMRYMAAKAEALLPKAGGRPRSRVDLTARELEVLQLLAEGGTNEEISEALVISRRTVEYHLQNIYGKLAVNSRAAAIAWFARHGGPEASGPQSQIGA